ncbi:MAG: hypothetical protein WC805_02620 [Patescibacteria group bacterium]|jgi:hypothetical protein
MTEIKSDKKSSKVQKLKKLVPKKTNYIIVLPDEIEDGAHWLFWVLIILLVLLAASAVVINYTDLPTTLSLLF